MNKAASSFSLAPDLIAQAHTSLLTWYAAEQRNLPWRTTSDPYAILVSEVMLQQTQVDRVLPKYQQVLPAGEAYNWNQALMDLGATICTSNNPQCTNCPLQESCQAYTDMRQYSLFPSGTVVRQLRKVAEKKSPYQAQPFTSSNRYFRGRIVATLRSLSANERMPLAELGPSIKPEFGAADLPWLQQIVAGLVRDGLLDSADNGVRLP